MLSPHSFCQPSFDQFPFQSDTGAVDVRMCRCPVRNWAEIHKEKRFGEWLFWCFWMGEFMGKSSINGDIHGYIILVAISSTESRVLGPQKPSILESQSETLPCYKIKDHGLATTQEPPILIIFGLYLGRSLILQTCKDRGPNTQLGVHKTLHFG